MKKLSCILLLTGLVSCSIKTETTETKMKFAADSIEYHGIGQDHSLQTTPYWRVHLKENGMWVRMNQQVNVGDTVTILLRK